MLAKLKSNLTLQILIGMGVGLVLGLVFGDKTSAFKVVGEIFLRLIQMSVGVFILFAVIEALGSLELTEIGKIGIKLVLWFIAGTILAALFGTFFGNVFIPGKDLVIQNTDVVVQNSKSISEILLAFFPNNIIDSLARGDMIQVIIFALFFGVALSNKRTLKIGDKALEFVKDVNQIFIELIKMVMRFAPLGIMSLMMSVTGSLGIQVIKPLIKFLATFALASGVYMAIVILFVAFYVKVKPVKLIKGISRMSIVAMTTTSSAITLPIQMEDTVEKLGVSKRISDLVNPLGMVLNSNGLALYLSLASVTLLQVYNVEVSMGQMMSIILLSTLACMGTVVVPGGGLVALTIVVPFLGLPFEAIALLAGIDWFSGVFRTLLNVAVEPLVAVILAKDVNELNYEIINNN